MDLPTFLRDTLGTSPQHRRFYHFTDRKNLDSIRASGLLCTYELRRRNMLGNVTTGGDSNSLASDIASGTDRYVCLCFTTGHPMTYIARTQRGLDPVYLHINPNVLLLPNVMITAAPSNQTGVAKVAAASALDNLDLEVI
ncbi:DarT ssDNA thymidine ADP-ribosyltransferase family protein [Bradyrhizobium sp. HKCCYLR20261]|uniref:DarT ssDNA thymidine ADP-ribosyltransferase family protein n=1 Tax=Bradyrhizobium sp. HKCCYLR20261 TaxID=3420760 RepID=UPI003EB75EB7